MTLVCNARKKGHDFAQSVKSMVIILKLKSLSFCAISKTSKLKLDTHTGT